MLSYIICTHNGAARLAAVVKPLVATAQAAEILIIDNASDAANVELLTQLVADNQQAHVPLRCVREERKGLGHARLRGLQECRGELFMFVDDDNILHGDYSHLVHDAFSDAALGLIGAQGTATTTAPTQLPPWFADQQLCYACGIVPAGTQRLPYGACMAGRTAVILAFIKNGVEHACLGRTGTALAAGDDSEIAYWFLTAGWKTAIVPDIRFDHLMPEARLHLTYFHRMIAGMGACRLLLLRYQDALDGRSPTARWYRYWIYEPVSMIPASLRARFKASGLERAKNFALLRGRFSVLWRQRHQHKIAERNIRILQRLRRA